MSHEGERYISEVARLLSALALLGDIHIKLPTSKSCRWPYISVCGVLMMTEQQSDADSWIPLLVVQ